MASPVGPADFCGIRVNANSSECDKAQSAAQAVDLLCTFFSYLVNDDRTFTDEFKADIGVSGSGVTGLDAPSGVTATSDRTTDVQVAWGSVSGATSYSIWRGTSSDTGAMSLLIDSRSASPYEDTTAVVGTIYYYAVKAQNATLISGFSAVASGQMVSGGGYTPVIFENGGGQLSITTPVGATSMIAEIWGPGGNGGSNSYGGFYTAPSTPGGGGGGASGSYLKITGITISAAGEPWVLAPGAPGSPSFLYKAAFGSSIQARSPNGGNGHNATSINHGTGGTTGGSCTNSLALGSIDTNTAGNAGSDGTNGTGADGTGGPGTGGAGGSAIASHGAGGDGIAPAGSGSAPPGSPGSSGAIILTFA